MSARPVHLAPRLGLVCALVLTLPTATVFCASPLTVAERATGPEADAEGAIAEDSASGFGRADVDASDVDALTFPEVSDPEDAQAQNDAADADADADADAS